MAELDLDDLLNTGLEDVNTVKIDPVFESSSTQPSLSIQKKVNYNTVDTTVKNTSSVSPLSPVFIKTPPHLPKARLSYSPKFSFPESKGSSLSNSPVLSNGFSKQELKPEKIQTTVLGDISPRNVSKTSNGKRLKRNSVDNIGEFSDIYQLSVQPVIPGNPNTKYLSMDRIYSQEQLFGLCVDDLFNSQMKTDPWSSIVLPMDEWTKVELKQSEVLVDLQANKDGFLIEVGPKSIKRKGDLYKYNTIDIDLDFPFYKTFFKGKKTTKYYMDKEKYTLLIVDNSTKNKRAILKTGKESVRCVVPMGVDPAKYLPAFPKVEKKRPKVKCFDKKTSAKIENEIDRNEDMTMVSTYRIGVIYIKEGQNTENEYFANDESDCSKDFWDFMDLIAEKIELKGWSKFAAGLDTKHGCTGKYSYFKQVDKYSLMFHTCPLLPNQPDETQKLERKRHIGNDVVVIAFLDRDRVTPFDPRSLTSHYTNAFIVVQPKKDFCDGAMCEGYTVNATTTPSNHPFPPYIQSSFMKSGKLFQEFFLKKLINAERMMMHSTAFLSNARKTRAMQLELIGKKYL
ncbi:rap GTPase-activating protein, putative [Entamoeba invadens IP1]|uniref:rap GTPase-activating protein, putative n=1 Tax=Entamoeba invadens IP1 TaxID=370355 RepID=UPI0002C3D1BE|nr:rap GTPase-activating protein, putative [Entamoeba invadens IP1]ELP92997.1 rap GTPase-activating protein, putative [Entamoeba invadens IP1]|eukprot:XP_004259768.1 rap GTPase-activating protein, putative [Entamoeba invadens IP1]